MLFHCYRVFSDQKAKKISSMSDRSLYWFDTMVEKWRTLSAKRLRQKKILWFYFLVVVYVDFILKKGPVQLCWRMDRVVVSGNGTDPKITVTVVDKFRDTLFQSRPMKQKRALYLRKQKQKSHLQSRKPLWRTSPIHPQKKDEVDGKWKPNLNARFGKILRCYFC